MSIIRHILLFLLLLTCQTTFAQKSGKTYTVSIQLSEKGTKEPIIMATIALQPTGALAVTDYNGHAELKNIPEGDYTVNISYVGFEPIKTQVKINKDTQLRFAMNETSLALQEVSVVAKQNASGTSTSSIISRQAIDHLQATSLADIMQLLPGAEMGNVDLTSESNTRLQIRSTSNTYNSTSAFGSVVIVDGVPMSNNGNVTQGSFSSTDYTGTDLRNISADDIEEVEVVRGIPSAEYGDLTSGMVVVHSKIGVTPWQVKGKVNPALMNFSLGKGLRMNKYGVLNFNADYVQAWGDPRKKTNSFDRYAFSVGYGLDISKKWHTDTKIRYTMSKVWSGIDPDAIQDGTETKNKNQSFSFTHNGKIRTDRRFSRNLSYTFGISLTQIDNRRTAYAGTGGTMQPIYTMMETGYSYINWTNASYLATGTTESRPGNIYAKLNNTFFIKSGKTYQNFKMGIDYKYDWNSGKGYYNQDEDYPLSPNGDSRPRAFSDVPGLHQFAAYIEDNFSWQYWGKRSLRMQLGGRFTAMQPFSDVRTFSFSPRLNISVELTNWLTLRGGIGINSKTPGLNYLYPDKKYADILSANYMSASDPATNILYSYTRVYDVEYSRNLKNANTTKTELGFDIKLPGNRKLSIVAYQDRTTNGFASLSEWMTYPVNFYNADQGLIITPGQPTIVDVDNPAATRLLWMTTGSIGNTDVNINKGIEFDFDLGKIKPLKTSIYLSGAWKESKSTSRAITYSNPTPLPDTYSNYGTTPFKLIWPAEKSVSKYRQFITTLRLVTNIPQLRMVASFTGQVIWHSSSRSWTDHTQPAGWINPDLSTHELTQEMLDGYIGEDGNYYATAPEGMNSFSIANQLNSTNDYSKSPVTWNVSARLTKEFGKHAGLSFFANNVFYYEPFLSQITGSKTLTQRENAFSFGVELFFNL